MLSQALLISTASRENFTLLPIGPIVSVVAMYATLPYAAIRWRHYVNFSVKYGKSSGDVTYHHRH